MNCHITDRSDFAALLSSFIQFKCEMLFQGFSSQPDTDDGNAGPQIPLGIKVYTCSVVNERKVQLLPDWPATASLYLLMGFEFCQLGFQSAAVFAETLIAAAAEKKETKPEH